MAVPETSLLRSGNKYYLLLIESEKAQNYYFKKMEVNIGRNDKSLVELVDSPIAENILIKGNYNIQID